MENLKHLNLTESDFTLINEALEVLPKQSVSGAMVDLLGEAFIDDPKQLEKFRRERKIESEKKERDLKSLIEDIRILQGKILLMKRYMIENKLMKQVDENLNNGK